MSDQMRRAAAALYQSRFGAAPKAFTYAPGRVNLLGEHTDYNGGLVLPMPLALGTAVAIGPGQPESGLALVSDAFDGQVTRAFDEKARDHWSDYVLGSAAAVGVDTPLNIAIASDLPLGSGLSSSAALEVASLRAMTQLTGMSLSPEEIALKARAVENDFVGLPCGIMDQFCVSVGKPGEVLFLNTRSLASRAAPKPGGHSFVIVHSGVSHKLTDDGYAARVAECAKAANALGVETLSDLSPGDLDRIARLPTPLDGRARHIVTENARVAAGVDALTQSNIAAFGQLMFESHASQRDDYAVSVAEVDALVEGAQAAGAIGARLTGGGFGGSIVALVENSNVASWCARIEASFAKARVLAVT